MNGTIKGLLFFCSFSIHAYYAIDDQNWAKTYQNLFTSNEMQRNKSKKELLFMHPRIKPCTQIIFSWNAQRPAQGRYGFYAQFKDKHTGRWLGWHKLVEWGKKDQRSFFNRTKKSTFHFARLEMNKPHVANGFKIKVVAERGATLDKIRGLFVTAVHALDFVPESIHSLGKGLHSVLVRGVPKISQMEQDHVRAQSLCSPTSTSMVVGALANKKIDPIAFSDYVYDEGLDAFGNWPFNTAHAYEHCKDDYLFYPSRLASFSALYSILKQGLPVVAGVRGSLPGAPKNYKDGHLLVVLGYDARKKRVICHDPRIMESENVRVSYALKDFVAAWERSHRLVYKSEKKS